MTGSAHRTSDQALKEAAVDWFFRRRAAPLSSVETEAFEEWLAGSLENREAYLAVEAFWSGAAQAESLPRFDVIRDQILRAVDRVRMTRRGGFIGVAALVIGLTGGAVYQFAAPKALATQAFKTAVGQQATVTLPDGSVVTLNTDTVVRTQADAERRLVYLDKGQAFFRVAKDRRRPFVVSAAGRTVTALGTAFDLRIDRGALTVLLLEGKVRVEAKPAMPARKADEHPAIGAQRPPAPSGRSTEMEPGSQLVASGDGDWRLTRADVERETSWLRGKIVFDDEALGDVVTELNRYSKRKMVIADESLAQVRLSGIYEPGDVKEFAQALRFTGLAALQEGPDGELRIVHLK
jgi:transmembrane sensor